MDTLLTSIVALLAHPEAGCLESFTRANLVVGKVHNLF
jgi:hypothetical protein